MVDLHREEDKKALIGTVTFYALLFLLFILLALFSCGKDEAGLEPSGGVAVSIGNPDDGGPDNSAAEQEEAYTPPLEEEYTPENQLTSDVDEAPEVKKTEPTVKPKPKINTPTEKPTEQQKPTETPKEVQKPNLKDLFGKDKTGAGKNGTADDRGGYKGRPDGSDGPARSLRTFAARWTDLKHAQWVGSATPKCLPSGHQIYPCVAAVGSARGLRCFLVSVPAL